jgi:hypothetical protein
MQYVSVSHQEEKPTLVVKVAIDDPAAQTAEEEAPVKEEL